MDAAAAALAGTGIASSFWAALDATFGQFGDPGILFPENAKSRNFLKLIRQTGKKALLTSSRGSVYESQNIDALFPNERTWFTNPAVEAALVPQLITRYNSEIFFNTSAIASGELTADKSSELAASTLSLQRAIVMLGGNLRTGAARGDAADPARDQGQQTIQRGQTATNPTTGARMIFDGTNWVPANGQ
jgi:hypothetical protein